MHILKHEFKKIVQSPVIWGLFVLTVGVSSLFMSKNFHRTNELREFSKIISHYGSDFNEASLNAWQQLVGEALNVEHIQSLYENIDMENIIEEDIIAYYGLEGRAAQIMRAQIESNQNRVDQLIQNNEHLNFFFPGEVYAMHHQLFGTVLKTATFALSAMTLLLSAFLFNYEFDGKSSAVIYAAKKGRRLQLSKLGATLIATTALSVLVLALILITYFLIYDYSGLWHTPISSAFTSERSFFFMSSYSLTFRDYLLSVITIILTLQILFVIISFFLSNVIRNSYFVPIIFILIWVLPLILQFFAPTSSALIIYSGFSPINMMLNFKHLFNISHLAMTFQHFEIITLTSWSIAALGLGWFSYRTFTKQDI